jgi:hypothetical protein
MLNLKKLFFKAQPKTVTTWWTQKEKLIFERFGFVLSVHEYLALLKIKNTYGLKYNSIGWSEGKRLQKLELIKSGDCDATLSTTIEGGNYLDFIYDHSKIKTLL